MAELEDGLLEGEVVLVSGATQGLGAGIAAAAARNGAAVVVTGRRQEAGEEVAARIRDGGGQAHFVACDVADVAQCRAAVQQTVERFGRVDGLVNSAGLTTRGSLLDTTPELFDQHIAVNTRGPFFLMQAAVEDMRRRGEGGSVVNILTMAAHGGQPHLAPYVTSKSAMVGLTKNAAFAHRWDRIRINGLNIGWTETDGEDAIQRRFHDAEEGWQARAAGTLPMGNSDRSTRSRTSWSSSCRRAAAW